MGAGLNADSAADAGVCAGLLRCRALILITAKHRLAHAARALRTQLDKLLGTGLDAIAASHALALVQHRQAGGRIHAEGAELAGKHAVPATQAAEGAAGVAAIERGLHAATVIAVVEIGFGAHLASAVASKHRHLGSLLHHGKAENLRHLLHHLIAAYGAEMGAQVGRLHGRIGESVASGITAATAVRTRQSLLYLLDARILLHLESLRDEEEDHGKHQTEPSQDYDSPDYN